MKFSRDGGNVECCVSVCSAENVEGTSAQNRYSPPRIYQDHRLPLIEGNVIRFVVKDYGRGIKASDFRKVFRPFLQADRETESLYGGTGLGLSITTKLVHGLGGGISLQSVEGEWTKFTVDIPCDEGPVNTEMFTIGLQNAKLLFVGCDPEEEKQLSEMLLSLQVDHANFASMRELRDNLAGNHDDDPSTKKTCIFIVNEAVHEPKICDPLVSRQSSSILITFGPCFTIKEACRHYRSLTEVLPSIFLGDLVRYAKSPKVEGLMTHPTLRQHSSISINENSAVYTNLRVLLAEDNIVNQKVLARILSRLGIENVEIVDNGAKAVEAEESKPFDVVFMDSTSCKM